MQKKEEAEKEDWKDAAIRFAVGAVRETGSAIVQGFHEKADAFSAAVARKIFCVLFLSMGFVFLFVGIAQIIATVTGLAFFGFLFSGVLSIVIGLILHIVKR